MGINLCNVYQDMIGVHGRGVRSYRIGSMVIIDVILTILFSAAIYQIPWINARFNFRILTTVLILLITLTHRLLCLNKSKD